MTKQKKTRIIKIQSKQFTRANRNKEVGTTRKENKLSQQSSNQNHKGKQHRGRSFFRILRPVY
jgi:hypothetical protein